MKGKQFTGFLLPTEFEKAFCSWTSENRVYGVLLRYAPIELSRLEPGEICPSAKPCPRRSTLFLRHQSIDPHADLNMMVHGYPQLGFVHLDMPFFDSQGVLRGVTVLAAASSQSLDYPGSDKLFQSLSSSFRSACTDRLPTPYDTELRPGLRCSSEVAVWVKNGGSLSRV